MDSWEGTLDTHTFCTVGDDKELVYDNGVMEGKRELRKRCSGSNNNKSQGRQIMGDQ